MSDFINAFEAFLAKPGSNSPNNEAPSSPSAGRAGSTRGVVVIAPSPEAEIPSTPIRKSTRRRRRKKAESESTTPESSESEESFDSMPSRRSSSDSVKPRRGARNRKDVASKPTRKTNGSVRESVKKKEKEEDCDDRIDLSSETSCRLCDKKDFKPETDALIKHYASCHFKTNLEAEIKNDSNCNICRAKKLRSVFGGKKELMFHMAKAHSRVENFLADELGVPILEKLPIKKKQGPPKRKGRRSLRSKDSGEGAPEVIDLDDSSKTSKDDDQDVPETNGNNESDIEESNDVKEAEKQDNNGQNEMAVNRDENDKSEGEETEDKSDDPEIEEEKKGTKTKGNANKRKRNTKMKIVKVDATEDENGQEPSRRAEARGPYQCKLCPIKIQSRTLMKRHGVDKHFLKKLQSEGSLPTKKPFNCSKDKCDFEGETAQAIARHYGIKHRGIDKYMDQLLGEKINSITKSPVKSDDKNDDDDDDKRKGGDQKEHWVVKRNKSKSETWVVNSTNSKVGDGESSVDEAESDSKTDPEDDASVASTVSKESTDSSRKGRKGNGPRSMEEFRKALKENLRTKDGSFCTAKDETSVTCVCGKVIRICNPYYWKYLVQKPRVVNGKLYARGHWYICEEVKKRGSEYQLSEEEKIEIKKELESSRKGMKRQETNEREESERKKIKTRGKEKEKDTSDHFLDDEDFEDEDEEEDIDPDYEKRQNNIKKNIEDLLNSRQVGETFLQDGPCYQVASELALCRECKQIPTYEREDLILKGKFTEESSNITCSFYAFRKLRMTRNGYLMVDGYLDPVKDPKESDIALWTPNPKTAPKDIDLAKIKYILGLIGDQFCNMVMQERKCLSLHMSPNKNVTWKRPVKGVREMCDVCKTTLFNYHWICGMCGLFVCLDCYQFRRGGLVKDKSDHDKNTDDYKWPYCTTGGQHHINNLMLAAIIPRQCLVDLAKKVHKLRVKWKIPQYCHQIDEIHGLFAQDDGFLGLQSTVNLVNSARNVFFPCQLCNNETFRWQFDLYKHYATKHYYEDILGMMSIASESPYRCPWPNCTLAVETENQIVIHYGLNHKAVVKLLERDKLNNTNVVQKVPGIRSNMLALPSTYKCPICGATLPAKHRTDHLTVHFKDKMSPLLAKDFPYNCPKCRYVALDRTSLIRHFATRHGIVEVFLKGWLERHGRQAETCYVPPPPKIRPPDQFQPECRLCEEFPTFSKYIDFHKHLAECHFRMELNNELPQVAPFLCPMEGCSLEAKNRTALIPHYGVNHKAVFKYYNKVMGYKGNDSNTATSVVQKSSTSLGRPRGSYTARGRVQAQTQACLVCEEHVSPETMVFHLAHRHFQDKVAHLPKSRPFKCPDCSHINEFQGGLVKHYGNYHGVFNKILKDMGLLDARDDISKSGIKFCRPRVERFITSGPNSNVALELARTAAIWSGNSREEEDILKEVAQLKELERTVEVVIDKAIRGEQLDQVKKEVEASVDIKKEPEDASEQSQETEEAMAVKVEDDGKATCLLCDHCPTMQTKSDLLRHLVEKHFKQKMYAKLIYKTVPGDNNKGSYKCPLCEFENTNQMNSARHYGIKHRFAHKLYEDIVCRPVFSTPLTRDGFMDGRSIRGRPNVGGVSGMNTKLEKAQNCKICKVEHESLASYQRHLIKVHFKTVLLNDCPKVKPFVCPNEGCSIERRDRFNLLMHYGGCQRKVWKILDDTPEGSVENLNDTSKSKCRICGKYFTSPRYMWGHMGEEHFQAELDADLPKEAPFKCPKCPIDNVYTGSDLRTLRVHYGTRHKAVMPHLAKKLDVPLEDLKREFMPAGDTGTSCQFCGKTFFNQMDYLKHSLLHVRKRVYQDLPENEPYQCPKCPFIGGSRITLLLHYGLQHNVVAELLKEDPDTLMVDMDFIVKQKNGLLEEERLSAVTNISAGIPATFHERYPELDNKRFPKCKLCNYRYFTKLDLYRHFADNHLKDKLCEALGPDQGKYSPHKCPEPGCLQEFQSRQSAWRHYGSKHGHLVRLMESEYKFNIEEWPKPMKELDLIKSAEEKKRALENHQITVKQHHEANVNYQEQLNQYQIDVSKHNSIVQQARYQAAQEQAETLAAQALASMAGAPYQQRPNPFLNIPPPPVAPQPPPPLPPQPPSLRPIEDPECLDITILPTLEYLENPKSSQNVCELCGEEFTNTNKTRDKGNHQVNHFRDSLLQALPANRFDCPKCSFTGRDRNALLKHVGLSHRVVNSALRKEMGGFVAEINEVTHDCKVCSQFFLNQNALNNHLCDVHYFSRLAKDVAFSSQPPFKCPKCTYEAKSHQMTVRHYGVKHGLLKQFMIEDGYLPREPSPPPPPPVPMARPPPPSYPEVNIKQSLMNHLSTPHYNMSSNFPQPSQRYQPGHQSWIDHYASPQQSPVQHTRQEEVSINCPVINCNTNHPNAAALCRHATDKHFFERFARELPIAPPFTCPICGKNSADQISLIRHWGVSHQMAIKVFNEQIGRPNCFDNSVLKKYEVRGFREMCPLCKGSFAGRQLLLRHLADTHFKDRMCNNMPDREGLVYQCPQCPQVARDRQSFVRHYGIVHRMVIKYLNEMGIHSLDEEKKSAPPSPATPQATYGHNESFSPRGYTEPMGSPGYYSPHSQTPQRSPAYHPMDGQQYTSPYPSPQYKSPQYVNQSPRNSIASPQDLSLQYGNRQQTYNQYDQRFNQPQDLSSTQPQDLSMMPQDLSKSNQPLDFSSHAPPPQQQPQNYHVQSQPVNLVQNQQPNYQVPATQKPLNVLVNDAYRQPPHTPGMPMTPGSQHSNPGTPQPPTPQGQHMSQPDTPQSSSAQSPAYRQPATPQPVYPQQTEFPPQVAPQPVILQNPQHNPSIQQVLPGHSASSAFQAQKKTSEYTPQGDEHIQAPEPGTSGPFGIYCNICDAIKARQPSDFYRHLAETHYKEYLSRFFPPPGQSPIKCPICPYENKEMTPMIRHFGVAHKKVKEAIGNQFIGKYVSDTGVSTNQAASQRLEQQTTNQASPIQVNVKCPFDDCEMEFSARYAFWQHMCDKHLKDDLLLQIAHVPSTPYQCPAPGCSYNTKDSRQALVRHYGMTHKIVQTILAQKFPDFMATDKFALPPKPPRQRSKTPIRVPSLNPQYSTYDHHNTYGVHPVQQHHPPHPVQPQQIGVHGQHAHYSYQSGHQQQSIVSYSQPNQHQQAQQIYQNNDQFDLNLDNLNPSDFSIPSLSEFLDNPSASFPNLSGEDLSHSGYITAAGHAATHPNMQFEPQIDGTFDPTSIGDQSLDGSGGSNPTTPEKNKSTLSPAQNTPNPAVVQKKYCEICGKEYEGKNRSMNKVQHMVHHFKDKLYESLPPKIEGDPLPFKCPEEACKFETKHKPDWARHFGSVHKHVEKLLAKYLEEHPDAWANQPENKELLRESSVGFQTSKSVIVPSVSVEPRPSSQVSGSNSDHLDSGEGLLCKIKELQQKSDTSTRLPGGNESKPMPTGTGRLAVELPKSDLTKFITSVLNEKNVPHAVDQGNKKLILSEQATLDQKVQSVIHEQQQIINNQKVQTQGKSSSILTLPSQSISAPIMHQQQSSTNDVLSNPQSSVKRTINRSQTLLTTVPGNSNHQLILNNTVSQNTGLLTTVSSESSSQRLLTTAVQGVQQQKLIQQQLIQQQSQHPQIATIQVQQSQSPHQQQQQQQQQQLIQVQQQSGQVSVHQNQQQISQGQPQQEKQEFRTVQIQLPPNVLKQSGQVGTLQLQMPSGQRLQLQQQVTHQYLKIQTPQGEQLIRVQTQPGGQIQIARQIVQVPSQSQNQPNEGVRQQQQLPQQQTQQQQQQPQLTQVLQQTSQPQTILTSSQPELVSNQQQLSSQRVQQQQQVQLQTNTIQKTAGPPESIVLGQLGKQNQGTLLSQQVKVHQQGTGQSKVIQSQPTQSQQISSPQQSFQSATNSGSQQDHPQHIIQSKIVQHNGRTYLVQFRAQKPIEPGKQILIKTNQTGVGGTALVQEVMDEVIRQQYQKQTDQQKISELAMQLQQQSQQHLEQTQSVKQVPKLPNNSSTKLTLQQQQLLLPTEPHPQIAAQHQQKQQQQQQRSQQQTQQILNQQDKQPQSHRSTSILQQQLEKGGAHANNKASATNPVQCMLCIEMPWFPNQEHLDNHYSTAHGIMKSTDMVESGDLEFSNADLEASLSSMTDLKDDAGDFETLLDALSPEPPDSAEISSSQMLRRKSVNSAVQGVTRLCELCGFEPKTKNKSRERMDHLAMKHFRDQMISELRKDKPMKCPRCDVFESKDRQQLFRHMISKHKVLDFYLASAIEKMKSEGKQPFCSETPQTNLTVNGIHRTVMPVHSQSNQSVTVTVSSNCSTGETVPTISIPQFTLPSLNTIVKDQTELATVPGSVVAEPIPQVTGNNMCSQHVTLAEFMDSGILDHKSEKIMQVDGMDTESDSDVESNRSRWQVDGMHDGSDSESTCIGSEVSHEEKVEKHGKGICPMCKEEMKYSRIYHFAASHFRPRLKQELPAAGPFVCPLCKEEHKHRMNLMSHYLGKHDKFEEWIAECQGETKPEWFDPNPPNLRPMNRQTKSDSLSSNSSPRPYAGKSVFDFRATEGEPVRPSPNKAEWFCELCHGGVTQRREVHYASVHFKDRLRRILPDNSPFICIVCNAEHKHFLNLSTHYLTQHGFLKEWLAAQGIEYGSRRGNASQKKEVPAVSNNVNVDKLSSKHVLSSSESDEEAVESESLISSSGEKSILEEVLQTSFDKRPADEQSDKQAAGQSTEGSAAKSPHKPRKRMKRSVACNLKDLIATVIENEDDEVGNRKVILKGGRDPPPVRMMTSHALTNEIPPHMWLCDGRLLILTDSVDERNLPLFQEQWRRGQPVIVANVSNRLDINIWHPDSFNQEFGHLEHDIINCKTHKLIPKVPLKWFWDGFEELESRMVDQNGVPMLLKLKDWPPEDDFAQYFPRRFSDFMKWIPLPDYTRREGRFNLASYMPEFFVRPDLGPKMYIAYGNPLYPEHGSTNLHLDMSDAVNLIVYVGIPKDGDRQEHFQAGIRAVDEAGCDVATKKRVRESGVVVGALWHVFHPRDADKIRDFLNKVALEAGQKLEPHNDPIHDQSVYLDGKLRQRLFDEYGVVGYAYPQCEGDTIFIPAGAPHQVRNIHNCIKVAEDFVSPENLEWCFYQTEEFRHLTDNHTNHEDKLQIKNILYHAVKECVSFLENYEIENGAPS